MVSHNITEVWHSFLHHINAIFCILSIGAINFSKTNLTIKFLGIFNHFYRFGLWWWANCLFSEGMCEATHTGQQGDHQNHSWTAEYINFSTSIMMSGSRETQGSRLPTLRLSYHPVGRRRGCCPPSHNKKLLASKVYHRLVLLWSPSPSQQEAEAPRGRLCYLHTGILILKTGRGWMT